jgi:hypothetical protein
LAALREQARCSGAAHNEQTKTGDQANSTSHDPRLFLKTSKSIRVHARNPQDHPALQQPSTDWTKRVAANQSTAVHRFAAIKRMNYAADNALGNLKISTYDVIV